MSLKKQAQRGVIFFLFAFWFYSSGVACAHGVVWEELTSTEYDVRTIKFSYDDGSIMPFAEVKISNPEGKTYQTGRSDRNGLFSFTPNTTGSWNLDANDGVGHLVQMTLLVNTVDSAAYDNKTDRISTVTTSGSKDNKLLKILFVTSLFINFAVIMTLLRQRTAAAKVIQK